MFTRASSMSYSRCPWLSRGCICPVSASTRYAAYAPASRRKSVLDSEQSPHAKPTRCSRTSSTASASSSRLTVPGRIVVSNIDRYGSEPLRCRVISAGSSGVPSSATRPVTTAIGSTAGIASRSRSRSSAYSRSAAHSLTSLIATTSSPARAKRTTCREMPRGSATSDSSGHWSSGRHQSRSSRADGCSASVALICNGMAPGSSRTVEGRRPARSRGGACPVPGSGSRSAEGPARCGTPDGAMRAPDGGRPSTQGPSAAPVRDATAP